MQIALAEEENTCQLSDVEIIETGVEQISEVDEDGDAFNLKETDYTDVHVSCYYCTGCQTRFAVTEDHPRDEVWKKVKEHLHESY